MLVLITYMIAAVNGHFLTSLSFYLLLFLIKVIHRKSTTCKLNPHQCSVSCPCVCVQVLRMMVGVNISDEQLGSIADRTIQEADTNGDMCISFSEFIKVTRHKSHVYMLKRRNKSYVIWCNEFISCRYDFCCWHYSNFLSLASLIVPLFQPFFTNLK